MQRDVSCELKSIGIDVTKAKRHYRLYTTEKSAIWNTEGRSM